MAVESVVVNGVDLFSQATRLEDLTGLYVTPGRRTKNVPLPGRHGDIRLPLKVYNSGTIVLKMWVMGVSKTTGLVPGGSSTEVEFQDRVDELMTLFTADLLTIDHTLPDGSVRRIIAELDQAPVVFAPEVASNRFGSFSVALTVPGAFWTDVSPVSNSITGVTGSTGNMTNFVGASAPMTALTVTFGPCSNPTISQGTTTLTYNGVISAGRQLVVDTGTWSLTSGTGTAWTPSYASLAYSPGPTWFYLDPTRSMVITLVHTGGGSATVTIAGLRTYMTG